MPTVEISHRRAATPSASERNLRTEKITIFLSEEINISNSASAGPPEATPPQTSSAAP